MAKGIVYNISHMESIAAEFRTAYDNANAAMGHIDDVKGSFADNYEGAGSELAIELCEKLKQHTELLRDCFLQMNEFVLGKKRAMEEADKLSMSIINEAITGISGSINGGGSW